MSQYRRSLTQGATYFFTVNTYQRRPLLTHPEVRYALRQAIEMVRVTMPFTIEAWVLLPDHLHAIWTLPQDDAAFGKRWGIIKSHVSKKCASLIDTQTPRSASRIKRRETDFWQRRFWEHQLRDDCDYERHVDYIHFNPVKHGLVNRVSEWEHSTFHQYVKRELYPHTWGADPGRIGYDVLDE
jgi:putative transposase